MRLAALTVCAGVTFAMAGAALAAPTAAQLAQVEPGMTRAALIALLGPPQNRTFNGTMEAVQYCRTGLLNDDYMTVWLGGGKVVALTTETKFGGDSFLCTGSFPFVDWTRVTIDGPGNAGGGSAQPGGGKATGTAFKVGPTALMTAAHVVEDATKIEVRCPGMAQMAATVEQRSKATDIAVLRVPVASAKWLPVTPSADVALGDPIFVIGFPVSDMLGTNPRYNDGTVSALSGFGSDASFLQISAPIQPGNSGGPVISAKRGVVGVVSSTAAAAAFVKRSGGALPQNINFAARADLATNLDRTLKLGVSEVAVADAVAATCFVEVQLAP